MRKLIIPLLIILYPCSGSLEVFSGIRSHILESPYQNGPQEIRVLIPESYNRAHQYRVLYVLPVEPGFNDRYGYGLRVFEKLDAHNMYDLIIVEPGFEKEPWFGDHASDPKTRQASYLKEFVIPFIEKSYSTPGTPEGRLLFGFSKSGWGAFSLILRHPDFFGYAAAWDAPLLFREFHYGMQEVYGTQGQLNTFRPELLVPVAKQFFAKRIRLILTGEKDWGSSIPAPGGGSHTVEMHLLLEEAGIPRYYNNALRAPHRWDRSWVEPTLKALMEVVSNGAN